MFDPIGSIVRSEAGRDRGECFCVVAEEEGYLLLADGKHRRVERPKRKKPGHVSPLTGESRYDHPAIQKLREGTLPSNKELRRALAAFRAESRRV